MRKPIIVAICVMVSGAFVAWVASPATALAAELRPPLTSEQKQARLQAGSAGIPALVADLGRVDWALWAEENCGDTEGADLSQIVRELAGRSVSAARAFGDVLAATATTSAERFGILHGLAGLDRVPPVLYDGLAASLSDGNGFNRMRASEILARLGDRRAAAVIKSAMRRETALATKNRMAYHLFLLGDPEGDPLGHRR